MSKRGLVKDAIAHKNTVRVPYCVLFCDDAKAELKKALGTEDVDAHIDNDVECVSIPWWNWHELASDWQGMDTPRSKATVIGIGPSCQELTERVKKVSGETGRYILATIWGSHWEKAYFSRGIENFLADMAGEPEFAKSLLSKIIEKNMVMLENILSIKEIDGVLLGSDWGTQQGLIMSPSTWEEMIRPGEQKEYELIHGYGKDVWVHSCGKIDAVIPRLVEMGVDVLNPIQPECMDIGKLKKDFGGKLTFWGGISTQRVLPYGTPEEVKREAQEVRELMSKDGGYILSPSQSIQVDVPVANMLALLEAAKS